MKITNILLCLILAVLVVIAVRGHRPPRPMDAGPQPAAAAPDFHGTPAPVAAPAPPAATAPAAKGDTAVVFAAMEVIRRRGDQEDLRGSLLRFLHRFDAEAYFAELARLANEEPDVASQAIGNEGGAAADRRYAPVLRLLGERLIDSGQRDYALINLANLASRVGDPSLRRIVVEGAKAWIEQGGARSSVDAGLFAMLVSSGLPGIHQQLLRNLRENNGNDRREAGYQLLVDAYAAAHPLPAIDFPTPGEDLDATAVAALKEGEQWIAAHRTLLVYDPAKALMVLAKDPAEAAALRAAAEPAAPPKPSGNGF